MSTYPIRWLLLLLPLMTLFSQSSTVQSNEDKNQISFMSYIPERSTALQAKINQALILKGKDYQPRSEHLTPSGSPIYSNRLILEDSPYLLQHAHNPVDWHPWGTEAFELAKQQNKPIFLSIGYSTCHWCHVMERESFENSEIASYINRHFIAIKVDREQHPVVDDTYMMAAQLISKRGGWPLSAFLTPEREPFLAATYFPPQQFAQLLSRIHGLWLTQQKNLIYQAGLVTETINLLTQQSTQADVLAADVLKSASQQLIEFHDELQGGFGEAPKFPQESLQFLMLRLLEQRPDPELVEMLNTNLDAMLRGGIYDHIGGGFHRYATDPDWLIPHFEKMLYNQALLARVYLYGWRLTGNPAYRRVVEETLDYSLREMRNSREGFYSASDADSEGEEGKFFLWNEEQVNQLLSPEDAALTKSIYGISAAGNFEGRNILHLPLGIEQYASQQKLSIQPLLQRLNSIRQTLYQARTKRIPPSVDTKVITAWNSMLITTLAESGSLLHRSDYTDAAINAANLIWQHCRTEQGDLMRICPDQSGYKIILANQEDYAYYAQALIALYDASANPEWLKRATRTVQQMQSKFWDSKNAGYFMSEATDKSLPLRPKASGDGAIPSGLSIAHEVLTKLFQRTGDTQYSDLAEQLITFSGQSLQQLPLGQGYMLASLLQQQQGEFGSLRFAGRGNVRLYADFDKQSSEIHINLEIAPDWHINSNQPQQSNLVPTRIKLLNDNIVAETHYPPPTIRALGFQPEPLSLFENRNRIRLTIPDTVELPFSLTLEMSLQACSEKLCLAPETHQLHLVTE